MRATAALAPTQLRSRHRSPPEPARVTLTTVRFGPVRGPYAVQKHASAAQRCIWGRPRAGWQPRPGRDGSPGRGGRHPVPLRFGPLMRSGRQAGDGTHCLLRARGIRRVAPKVAIPSRNDAAVRAQSPRTCARGGRRPRITSEHPLRADTAIVSTRQPPDSRALSRHSLRSGSPLGINGARQSDSRALSRDPERTGPGPRLRAPFDPRDRLARLTSAEEPRKLHIR